MVRLPIGSKYVFFREITSRKAICGQQRNVLQKKKLLRNEDTTMAALPDVVLFREIDCREEESFAEDGKKLVTLDTEDPSPSDKVHKKRKIKRFAVRDALLCCALGLNPRFPR